MPICRAAVEPRGQNSSSSSIDGQLSRFNDKHFSDLNLGQTYMASTLDLETKFLEVLNTSQIYPITSKVHFVKGLANSMLTYVPDMIHICPNNLPLWQHVTKPQQTNEHMREVMNHSTYTHLLNTIKSILTQTLEKICKKRVYGKQTLTTCISETL